MDQDVSYHHVRLGGVHGVRIAVEESVGAKDWLETIKTIRDGSRMM